LVLTPACQVHSLEEDAQPWEEPGLASQIVVVSPSSRRRLVVRRMYIIRPILCRGERPPEFACAMPASQPQYLNMDRVAV
jgi:hypothetical protein